MKYKFWRENTVNFKELVDQLEKYYSVSKNVDRIFFDSTRRNLQ